MTEEVIDDTLSEITNEAIRLTRLRLDSCSLPGVETDDDTAQRGVVLVVGGSAAAPGAMVLSATAALRAGAGALQLATIRTGEMAALLELPEDEVRANAAEVAQHGARQYNSVVVLTGRETWIAHPTAPLVHYRDGKPGLATAGSGDVLAGVIVGLAARGAEPLTAAMWGVWAHGSAGTRVSRSVGKVGFLARELLPEIPSFVND